MENTVSKAIRRGEIKSAVKGIGGLASILLPHAACLSLGIYKGIMNAKGEEVDIPFRYLLGANIVGTGAGLPIADGAIAGSRVSLEKMAKGAIVGGILAPIEFAVGWGLGYAGEIISDKVFY